MAEAEKTSEPTMSEDLARELEALGAIFVREGELQVENVPHGGDYCCVVRLHPRDLPLGLQFSLSDTYPKTSPKVEILSVGGDEEGIHGDELPLAQLLEVLYEAVRQAAGEPVMYALLDTAQEWLDGRTATREEDEEDNGGDGKSNDQMEGQGSLQDDQNRSEEVEEDPDGSPPRGAEAKATRPKGKKMTKKEAEEEEERKQRAGGKKPRMKTVSEVISRIQWDGQLRPEDFQVGYLDRFLGVLEKPFTAFSWVDLATVDDYTTLAIPRHRIQYFKYKDRIVWDKRYRLDDVFGSTGSRRTILDALGSFSKENQSVETKEVADCDSYEGEVNRKENEDAEEEHEEEQQEEEEEEKEKEEEDEKEKEKEKEKETKEDKSLDGSLPTARMRPKWRLSPRSPNHFLAIRLTDPVIIRCAMRIQDAVCEEDPRLEEHCTFPGRLHITLCTLHLADQQEAAKAVEALESMREGAVELLAPVTMLRLTGLGQFSGRVLYTAPEPCPALERLSWFAQARLDRAGISLVGNRPVFNPHMTLVKLGRSKGRSGPSIHEGLYERFSQAFVGVQAIDTIHLCSMVDPAQADGFYHCLASINVQSDN